MSADLLLNFHHAIAPSLLARFPRTALMDIDPGLLQFWISRGQLSVPPTMSTLRPAKQSGRRRPSFPIADCTGFTPDRRCVRRHGPARSIVDDNEVYENTKCVAFVEFAGLPCLTKQPLELVLSLRTERDAEERRNLEKRGWHIRPSREVASTPEAYQSYVQQSRGEFSCAKRSCMRFQNAWISDRTLCYLASGKPAVVQNTGPSSFLPNGEGLFRFSTVEEAGDALDAVNADYERHCRAARQIAETCFDAKQIAKDILYYALN